MINRKLSIAPMMDYTDRHFRYFLRLISKHVLLYTEMVVTGAILKGDRKRFLQYNDIEHPLALQLGGSNPEELAQCAKIAEDYGYDEVNLNIGCPSDRVQNGKIGACLMAEPKLVADCVNAMISAVNIPITIKTRIGIDYQDSYEELLHFVDQVAAAGCNVFIVHARKAWLKGLSPKQNREVPPLRQDIVHQLKKDRPELSIIINGGIDDLHQTTQQLDFVDGVMLGRAAYHNSYCLAEADKIFFNDSHDIPTREELLQQFTPYIQEQAKQGVPIKHMTRHILGLMQGMPGAKKWRRDLCENPEVIL